MAPLTIKVTTTQKWWVPVLMGVAKAASSLRILRASHVSSLSRLIANHGYIIKAGK